VKIIKKIILQLIAFQFAVFVSAGTMTIGMGLNGVADWTTEWPFVDIMKISRSWFTYNADGSGGWDTGYAAFIPVDSNLYPLAVPFDPDAAGPAVNQAVRTVWAIDHLPAGNYTFICEGTGRVTFHGQMAGSFNITGGGTFTVNVIGDGNAWMDIEQSQLGDNIRNIRIIMPGYSGTYMTNRFHPEFTSRISTFKALRFMDWGDTNDSLLTNWSDRAESGDYSYALNGVPYEVMIELANQLNLPPWICVPHQATDDYITQLIRLLRDNLNPGLKVYLEYSNETWNWGFTQSNYCETEGGLLGLPSFYGFRWAFHCKKACDIWRIFIQEFGSDERLVKLLATQVGWGSGTAGDPYPAEFMLDTAMTDPLVNPDNYKADAIAIAPYFAPVGMAALPDTATVDQVLSLSQQSIVDMTAAGGMVPGHKALAGAHGAELICYEGGQHMVRDTSNTLTARFIEANRDPRIYGIYTDYLNGLDASGVGLFCHFVDCGGWSRWGMWGSMEYQNQPIADAHKYRALLDWSNMASSRTPTITSTVTRTASSTPVYSQTRTRTLTVTPTITMTLTVTPYLSPTQTHIITQKSGLENVKVQPSLCNMRKGCDRVVFTGLPENAKIRIYSISGGLIFKMDRDFSGGDFIWYPDRRIRGNKTAAGIYLYVVYDEKDALVRGKFTIVR
jgi:hypothetical protein